MNDNYLAQFYGKSQNYTDREISDYDKMEKQLWNLMTTAFGFENDVKMYGTQTAVL